MRELKLGDRIIMVKATPYMDIGDIGYLINDTSYHIGRDNQLTDVHGAYWIRPEKPKKGLYRICIGKASYFRLANLTPKGNECCDL